MKKVLLAIMCLLLGAYQVSAQNHRIVSNTENQITLQVSTGDLQVNEINVEGTVYSQLTVDGCVASPKNIGKPELPMIVKMIEIPLCGDLHVTATAGRTRTLTAEEAGIAHTIYPAQPMYHKSYMGDQVFAKDETCYSTNAFYGMPLATVEKAGVARDVNMADVTIYPVQVNPVTNEVTIYEDITVTVTYDNVDMVATREMKVKFGSRAFGHPAEIINPLEIVGVRDAITTTPVKYVIIANSMFEGQLDSFANWKRRKGYLVEIAYTGTIGTTTTAIKNYISGLFNNATATNPAPTFVLLVGDQAQIPTYSGQTLNSHVTDLNYFQQVGNDWVPDCYWGRFSAQTVAQLTPQIEKTLTYEQFAMPDPTYLDRCVLVAGNDGGSTGDYGYSHANPAMHYFEDTYSSDFFTTTDSYYNPHASSDASTIRTKLSNGTGFANYSAHCGSTGWSDPSFSTTNVSSMTNTGKYGLMIGNCCQSNKFEESACFGEALLRASNKGAVGYIGGTDYTYWYHDYYWAVGARSNLSSSCTNCNLTTYNANNLGAYDRLCHTHNEAYSAWYVTQGAINYAGNMAVQSAYSASDNYVKYYWEIYELMGDPSVMPWLGQPDDMTIRIDNTAPVNNTYETIDGTTTFSVSTGAPYSYIAITQNLNLITAVVSDGNGNATITFPAMNAGETYELAASAQNYKTTFTTINVMAGEGARVTITDVAVTNDEEATAGAQLTLDVAIENRFPDAATNTVITATTTSNQITLTDATENVGTVNSGASQTLTASFGLTVSNNIADGDIAPIHFTVSYLSQGTPETTTFDYNLALVDAYLDYVSDSYTISGGNTDNVIDPGETVTLTIVDANTGHATAQNIVSNLSTYYNLAPVSGGTISIGTVAAQAQCNSVFTIHIGTSVPNGTRIPYFHHIYSTTNSALTRIDTIWLTVGTTETTETWESGTMTELAWTSTGNYPWELTTSGAYAGTYCARSTNYQVNSSESDLEITFTATTAGNVSYYSKVSSESGYDKFFCYIDGIEKENRSGNGSWTQSTWPVDAGTHTLRFTYEKDYSYSSNSDRAWVDNITLPIGGTIAPVPEGLVIANAGLNANSHGYEAEASTFDATLLNNSATPINNVTLTLSTTSNDITLTDATETIASLAANDTTNFANIFAGSISNNVADGTLVNCTVTANYQLGGSAVQQTYNFSFTIHSGIVDEGTHTMTITSGNGDNEVNPGENIQVVMTTNNVGLVALNNVSSVLSTTSAYATISNGTQTINTIAANGSATTTYAISIAANTPDNTNITFTHTANGGVHGTDTYTFTVNVRTEAIVALEDINETHAVVSGNSDSDINPGETWRFNVTTRNNGRADAHNAVSTLTTDSPYATISNGTQNIGTIAGEATANTQFDVAFDANTPDNTVVNFVHTMISDEDTCTMNISVTVVEITGSVVLVDASHSISIIQGNGDANINPGEIIKVSVYTRNDGTLAANNVVSSLTTTSAYATIPTPVVNHNTIAPGANVISQYDVNISANTPNNTVINFNHQATDGTVSCTDAFSITVVANPTSIAENGISTVTIYPNPTSSNITIDLGEGIDATNINLYNTFGQLISSKSVQGSSTEMNLETLANGLYFIRIYNGNQLVTTSKVIKK